MPAHPWTIRPVYGSSTALSLADGEHPWRSRWQADSGARQSAWRFLRPGAKAVYNSAFPVQANDGPAWTGRGMTVALQGGLAVEFGGSGCRSRQSHSSHRTGVFPRGERTDRRRPLSRRQVPVNRRRSAAVWGSCVRPAGSRQLHGFARRGPGDARRFNSSTVMGSRAGFPAALECEFGWIPPRVRRTRSPLNLGILGLTRD